MAACCRVATLASRSLSWRSIWTSGSAIHLSPYLFRPTACTSRLLNSKVVETESPGEYTHKHKRGFLGRFWDWLHTDIGQDEYIMDETEKHEREVLLQRVQEMYFAKPPVAPDMDFYKEAFETLVKYNDRIGVQTLWRLMVEMKVEADGELAALVEPFLEKTQKNVWFD